MDPSQQSSGGFTSQDVAAAIMSGNEALMQWYALTHHTTIPVNVNAPLYSGPAPGGGSINIPQSSLLVLGLVIVGVVFVIAR